MHTEHLTAFSFLGLPIPQPLLLPVGVDAGVDEISGCWDRRRRRSVTMATKRRQMRQVSVVFVLGEIGDL